MAHRLKTPSRYTRRAKTRSSKRYPSGLSKAAQREIHIGKYRCIEILAEHESYIDFAGWGGEITYRRLLADGLITMTPYLPLIAERHYSSIATICDCMINTVELFDGNLIVFKLTGKGSVVSTVELFDKLNRLVTAWEIRRGPGYPGRVEL